MHRSRAGVMILMELMPLLNPSPAQLLLLLLLRCVIWALCLPQRADVGIEALVPRFPSRIPAHRQILHHTLLSGKLQINYGERSSLSTQVSSQAILCKCKNDEAHIRKRKMQKINKSFGAIVISFGRYMYWNPIDS